jgi:chorismate-pyruvate lyase
MALMSWPLLGHADVGKPRASGLPTTSQPSAASQPSAEWHHRPGSAEYHLEAALLLQTLNADLLSHDSATLTLERWCADQRLAPSPRIVVERVRGAEKGPTDEQLAQLSVKDVTSVRYRQVKLMCGSVVLSEADNWYVPERLTPEINKVLDTTDTPFGRAVQALNFRRHTISARVLAQLLPERWWELRSADLAAQSQSLCLPAHVLEHRAILSLPDGTPFSEVVETYTANVLTAVRAKIGECPT